MNEELKQALWEGEEVRWTGRPKPFKLLDAHSKTSTVLIWCVSAVILLAVLVFLVPTAFQGTRSLGDVAILSAVALFLPGILSARPLLDKRCLEQQTIYAITNYRILAIVKGQVMYLPLGKELPTAVDSSEGGYGNVRFGETVGKSVKKSRVHAVVGLHAEGDVSTTSGLLFYNIDQPEQLLSYLA